MVLLNDLTPAQEHIIKKVCYLQLSSLRRISNNEHLGGEDLIMLMIENEISKEDFMNQLELNISRFKKYGREPQAISSMDKRELGIFKYIFKNVSKEYQVKYPNAVNNLWQRLFLIEGINNTCYN